MRRILWSLPDSLAGSLSRARAGTRAADNDNTQARAVQGHAAAARACVPPTPLLLRLRQGLRRARGTARRGTSGVRQTDRQNLSDRAREHKHARGSVASQASGARSRTRTRGRGQRLHTTSGVSGRRHGICSLASVINDNQYLIGYDGASPINPLANQINNQTSIKQIAIISIKSQSNQTTTTPHNKQINISNLFLCIHTEKQKYNSLIIFKDNFCPSRRPLFPLFYKVLPVRATWARVPVGCFGKKTDASGSRRCM